MVTLNWQAINIILSALTATSSFGIALYALWRRRVAGAFWFSLLCAAVGYVAFWYIWEAAAGADLNAYVTFSKWEYIGLTTIPAFWLGFALTFSGREQLVTRTFWVIMLFIPLVITLLAFTNEWHGLIWQTPRFDLSGDFPIYTPDYGAGFWVYIAYSYLIFLAGSVVLWRQAYGLWNIYRAQAAVVLAGTAMPWLSNLLGIFDTLNPVPYLYLNALFMGIAVVFFAFALFRLRLLDLTPLAYDTIFNNVPDGLIVTDLQERIVALNRTMRRYLDPAVSNPIGQPLASAFSPYIKDVQSVWEAFRDQTQGTKILPMNDAWIEVRVALVADSRGRPRGRLYILNDVTARRQMEHAQQEARAFAETMRKVANTLNSTLDTNRILALILESLDQIIPFSHANIMLVEADGYTTRVYQARGYTPASEQALMALRFDYRDFESFRTAAAGTEPLVIPDTSRFGGWRHLEGIEAVPSYACTPIVVDKQLVGFINVDGPTVGAMSADLAGRLQILASQAAASIKNARLYEQTRAQTEELARRVESLTITQQVYREIVFTMNTRALIEITLDAVLRLSQADGAFIALFKDGALDVSQRYGNYDMAALEAILREQSGIIRATLEARRPLQWVAPPNPLVSALDQTRAQIALPLAADARENERVVGLIVLETHAPARFTDDRFQLLGLIADRLAVALENVRLVEALQDRATELEALYLRVSNLEHLKSDMIRIAAHDLKNPLSVILSYLELLAGDYEIPNVKETYQSMHRSAKRMLQIIEDFLSLDRIEQIAQQQTQSVFDMRDLVTRAIEEYTPRAVVKKQTLALEMAAQPCEVYGDAVQLYEALSNFVSNAIKYTPDGGHITVHLQATPDHFIRLEVRDDGYGIPQDKQERLFQPFYRAKTKETRHIEGTGLGLYLTKSIIERQNGALIFRSEHGKGSVFGFQLPRYDAAAASAIG